MKDVKTWDAALVNVVVLRSGFGGPCGFFAGASSRASLSELWTSLRFILGDECGYQVWEVNEDARVSSEELRNGLRRPQIPWHFWTNQITTNFASAHNKFCFRQHQFPSQPAQLHPRPHHHRLPQTSPIYNNILTSQYGRRQNPNRRLYCQKFLRIQKY